MRDWAATALLALFGVTLLLLSTTPAAAQFRMVKAAHPLWNDSDDRWPQGGSKDDGFYCSSRLEKGSWYFERKADVQDRDSAPTVDKLWLRLVNQHGFSCAAYVDAEGDKFVEDEVSYFIHIGTDDTGRELWVQEVLAGQGYEYLLLARPFSKGMVRSFDVLARDCPQDLRRPDAADASAYECRIDDRATFMRFAMAMAARPSVGTLTEAGSLAALKMSEDTLKVLDQATARRRRPQ